MANNGPKSKTVGRPSTRSRGTGKIKDRQSSESPAKRKARVKTKPAAKANNENGRKRLGPGQLDGLVLSYMKKHKATLPLTPTKVARGIKRSSGAVANCLARLEHEKKVKLAGIKPRRYELTSSTS